MRELAETAYQFTEPFVLDSTHSETLLDLAPTPLAIGREGDRRLVADGPVTGGVHRLGA